MPKQVLLESWAELLWAWQAISLAMLSVRLFAKAFTLEAAAPSHNKANLRPMGLVDSVKGSCPDLAKRRQATANRECTIRVRVRLLELSTSAL